MIRAVLYPQCVLVLSKRQHDNGQIENKVCPQLFKYLGVDKFLCPLHLLCPTLEQCMSRRNPESQVLGSNPTAKEWSRIVLHGSRNSGPFSDFPQKQISTFPDRHRFVGQDSYPFVAATRLFSTKSTCCSRTIPSPTPWTRSI